MTGNLNTWKTIQLGTNKSHKDLSKALEDGGFVISDYAASILKKVDVAPEATEADLVLVTVVELGFPNGATWQQIRDKALSFGLGLCPAEVGPQLRLQYPDQPKDEWIRVGMEPVRDSGGYMSFFNIGYVGDVRLLSTYGSNNDVLNGRDRWVFVRRK